MPLKPGPMELVIILVIVMMIFGVGRLLQGAGVLVIGAKR